MTPPLLPPELVADILDTFLLLSPSHALRTRQPYMERRLDPAVLDAEGFKRLLDVLVACKGVTHLSYHCFDPSFLEDLTEFVASQWPGLRYLRADQSHALYSLLARLPDLEALIASYINFPAPGVPASPPTRISTPSPPSSGRSSPSPSPSPSASPAHPVRPTFRLKRFGSGSSPAPSNFHLLTSTSTTSLASLDLPISSPTSQDLEAFRGLRKLTLTLAERYIRPLPAGAVGMGGREDAHCLRRLKRLLAHAGRSGVPLSTLEIYDPPYALTEPFKPEVSEEADVLAAVPAGVEELDLATLDIGLGYVKSAFAREGEEQVCEGVKVMVLSRGKRAEEGAEEMRSVLGRRGVEVRWA